MSGHLAYLLVEADKKSADKRKQNVTARDVDTSLTQQSDCQPGATLPLVPVIVLRWYALDRNWWLHSSRMGGSFQSE